MKDFPLFTTENGIASLVLREIPYKKTAYVLVRSSAQPETLIEECAAFCEACGAEMVFASGHSWLEKLPFHTAVWRMSRPIEGLPDTDAALWPVQKETLDIWKDLYNRAMAEVPNSAWMTEAGAAELLEKGDGYFIHRGETPLGIGRASGEQLRVVAAARKGAGEDVVLALRHAMTGERMTLEVASENQRAVRLYQRLGFVAVEELSRWYKIK